MDNIKIVKRKDGRYFARFTINGRQKSIYGKTQIQCYENLKQAIKEMKNNPTQKSYNNIKLYAWLEQWYTTYKVPKLKEGSVYQIRNCIENHIKPHIDNIQLNKIRPIDVNSALNKIASSRMKKYTYDCYVESLREAYKNQIIRINISEMLEKVIHIREKGRSLTVKERGIFFENTKKIKYGKIFEFMLFSGSRPQGARNLKWQDIKEDKIFINETKSENGPRFIPLFESIKKLLQDIKKNNEFVFPISEAIIKKNFKKLKNLCGFEFTPKDLRHTFATICGEIGIDDMTLAKWMGHGNPNTTKQYYREVLSDFEIKQAEVLNSMFKSEFDTKNDTKN
ncbi:MAG: hypothetical protein EOM55_04095 [Clostridia bacterium]|nr:hypothetical protein [Clostridia bacterium]